MIEELKELAKALTELARLHIRAKEAELFPEEDSHGAPAGDVAPVASVKEKKERKPRAAKTEIPVAAVPAPVAQAPVQAPTAISAEAMAKQTEEVRDVVRTYVKRFKEGPEFGAARVRTILAANFGAAIKKLAELNSGQEQQLMALLRAEMAPAAQPAAAAGTTYLGV